MISPTFLSLLALFVVVVRPEICVETVEPNVPTTISLTADEPLCLQIFFYFNLTLSLEVTLPDSDDFELEILASASPEFLDGETGTLCVLSENKLTATTIIPLEYTAAQLSSSTTETYISFRASHGADAAVVLIDTRNTDLSRLVSAPYLTPRASTHFQRNVSATRPAYFNTLQMRYSENFDIAMLKVLAPGLCGQRCDAGEASVFLCSNFVPPSADPAVLAAACAELAVLEMPLETSQIIVMDLASMPPPAADVEYSQWFVFTMGAGQVCDSVKAEALVFTSLEPYVPLTTGFNSSVVYQLLVDFTTYAAQINGGYAGENQIMYCLAPCTDAACSSVIAAEPLGLTYDWEAGAALVASYDKHETTELAYSTPRVPITMVGGEPISCYNTHMSLTSRYMDDYADTQNYIYFLASEVTNTPDIDLNACRIFVYFASVVPKRFSNPVSTFASRRVSGEFFVECAQGDGSEVCTYLISPYVTTESLFLDAEFSLDACETFAGRDQHTLCTHTDGATFTGITPKSVGSGDWAIRTTVMNDTIDDVIEFQARVANIVYFAPQEGSTITHRELSQLDQNAFLIPIDHESFGGIRLSGCGEASTGCASATLINSCIAATSGFNDSSDIIASYNPSCDNSPLTHCSLLGLGANADGGNVASTDILYSDLTADDRKLTDGLLLHVFTALPYNPTVGTHTSVDLLDAAGEVIAPRLSDASLVLKHARAVDDETADVTLAFTAADAPLYPATGARDLTYTLAYVSSGADTVQTPCFWASNALGTRDLGALAAGGSASVSANVERGQWAMTLIVTDSLTGSQAVYAPVLVEKYEVTYVMWLVLVALVVILVAVIVVLVILLRRHTQKKNVSRRLEELESDDDSSIMTLSHTPVSSDLAAF
eukprot:gnl/Chilomastix_cuspidata/2622.p1 GENE.gnl/Chilomastix_cuspidata/2622~~gnl/Chilomastix_cuspidata/2622.p1  ORF type:complete len:897 (-),score=399.70 gnl/Chilomastix_cuspidata/2622:64-2727(-)